MPSGKVSTNTSSRRECMKEDVKKLCVDLVAAWNSHDIDRILSHYSEDFVLISPRVRDKYGVADGTIRGRENVRKWWGPSLKQQPDFRMEYVDVLVGMDSFVSVQRMSFMEKESVSHFWLDDKGLIKKEIFFY